MYAFDVLAIAATLLLTSGMTASPSVDDRACFGLSADALLAVHVPTGSWYRKDFDPGPGVGLRLGYRASHWASVGLSWHGGISNSAENFEDVRFELATLETRVYVPNGYAESFVEAGLSPSARMRIGGLRNRGYATHVGGGLSWGRSSIRGTAKATYHFVRYTRGSANGYSGTLGRQRHGDLLLFSIALTLAPHHRQR